MVVKLVEIDYHFDKLFLSQSKGSIVIDLSDKYQEEMQLVFCRSSGTKYEIFIHEFIEMQQHEMEKVLAYMKNLGYKVKNLTSNELHVFLSSYTAAMLEPIIHNYTKEETKECLLKIQDFFTPGWMNIMGF